MQVVKDHDPFLPFIHKTHKTHPMLLLFPALVLGSVIAASLLLGTADKPADELNWLQSLASTGNTGAEIQLGTAYQNGQYGLVPDAKKAFGWFKQAADAGNAYAEDRVANAYARGLGVDQDESEAEKWWRQAIKDGNADARLQLGEALIQEGHLRQAEQFLE